MSQLRPEDQRKLWLGQVLGCDGDGCLAATEHEAGIEWVTGHRLGSGSGHGSGHEFGCVPTCAMTSNGPRYFSTSLFDGWVVWKNCAFTKV